ncbi:hypothetical protein CMO91_05755 [Candidatus Woesearchaeota archaeon]|nr:hypothetical protein [Candidatus Woesearchaeota archaeon]|tara:strand:+ start:1230 stop:1835 length:606 start_codon:yes stop_codon:yes gene_type:complete
MSAGTYTVDPDQRLANIGAMKLTPSEKKKEAKIQSAQQIGHTSVQAYGNEEGDERALVVYLETKGDPRYLIALFSFAPDVLDELEEDAGPMMQGLGEQYSLFRSRNRDAGRTIRSIRFRTGYELDAYIMCSRTVPKIKFPPTFTQFIGKECALLERKETYQARSLEKILRRVIKQGRAHQEVRCSVNGSPTAIQDFVTGPF